MMHITVHLESSAAEALHQGTRPTGPLEKVLGDLGVTLAPLHPGTSDAGLATQFYADVDPAQADHVCARLLTAPGVEGAYAKPAGEPPSSP
jgi:hypothetical protein